MTALIAVGTAVSVAVGVSENSAVNAALSVSLSVSVAIGDCNYDDFYGNGEGNLRLVDTSQVQRHVDRIAYVYSFEMNQFFSV